MNSIPIAAHSLLWSLLYKLWLYVLHNTSNYGDWSHHGLFLSQRSRSHVGQELTPLAP